MTRQWIRELSLVVGDNSGQGLELGQLRVKFHVIKNTLQTPNVLDATIFNLSDNTVRMIQKEFTKVQLTVGYPGALGIIFTGGIIQKRAGRLNPTDTYLNILASDGDQAYNWSVVNQSFAAGTTQTQQYQALKKTMEQYGVTGGPTPNFLGTQQNPRGKACFGMTRDYLRDFATHNDLTWSIQDGQLQLLPRTAVSADEVILVTDKTGMVGMPQLTLDGIMVRCLLNPALRINGRINLDNTSIQLPKYDLQYTAINDKFPGLDPKGLYKVIGLSHMGDTRGNEWYSDMVTIACDGTAPLSRQALTMGVGS